MNRKELWLKIKGYHFDHIVMPNAWGKIRERFGRTDAYTLAFADKIARKHQWKKPFCLKAISEYKKFIFLAVISDFNVTPSKYIDVVWHEHLLFTKAYRDFCSEIIDYNLDHFPELIPIDEQTETYKEQYLATIRSYIKEFGVLPLADVWDVTKFDKETILGDFNLLKQKKKEIASSSFQYNSVDQTPLYESFNEGQNEGSFPEFDGFDGGGAGGAGASGDWGNDDGGSDGGDAGGDGGGCSGGCGGGD